MGIGFEPLDKERAGIPSYRAYIMVTRILKRIRTSGRRLVDGSPLMDAWAFCRAAQLQREYEQRREYYSRLGRASGVQYIERDVAKAVQRRIRERGYTPTPRLKGEVHTFACVPQFSWHRHLLPDLRELGPVSLFDYVSHGFSPEEFYSADGWDRARIKRRREMVEQVLPEFRVAHRKRPVDWVFCYGGGQDVSATVIEKITGEFGVPTVNMTLDDKQGWVGPDVGEHCTGARDITPRFDMFLTSARVACEWHLAVGGRPIYMPEGFDKSAYHPMAVKQDIPVSFVGQRYGYRDSVVKYLRGNGVPIEAYGPGWAGGYVANMVEIFNRSVINLGMGGIGYSESLTNVKGRDFEIPGTGGGVYLTSFNSDLAQHFRANEEILCYRNRDEMLELIRYYLARADEAREITRRARQRCLCEHRWLHRYMKALGIVGVLHEQAMSREII